MVLVCGAVEVAVVRLADRGPTDLGLVDELARLQLAARRLDCSIRLRHARVDLSGLLDLVGLSDVVGLADVAHVADVAALRQAVGETEGGEQGRVQEVVVPDDPVA